MPLILNIETATRVCSVAVAKDGEVISIREDKEGQQHAEKLTVFIDEAVREAGIKFSELDAVAVSKGPGSYTGLRIGVSAAKGLCYALDKPLIAVDTLKALCLSPDLPPAPSEGGGVSSSSKREEFGLHPADRQQRFFTSKWQHWKFLHPRAFQYRKNPTEAEAKMWTLLRRKNLGVRFRRQHPINQFIPDFVCIEKKLIIEIDGPIHEQQKDYDVFRTAKLNVKGYTVIRFTNEEVLFNTEKVIQAISSILSERQNTSPSLGGDRGEFREKLFCPMLDARRMEVYCAVYDAGLREVKPVCAEVISGDSFAEILEKNQLLFFGDGSSKCKNIITHPHAVFMDHIHTSASAMALLSSQSFENNKFVDLASFEPYYLKNFVAKPSRKLY